MCGRYALFHSDSEIAKQFEIEIVTDLKPRYNIAPTQQVATISLELETHQRQLKLRKWGLIPSWSKDATISARLINARAETVAEKPSFRRAFRQRRCLIITDGFYEWQKNAQTKQPFFINLKNEQTFAFAGLWESWKNNENQIVESCTIITTTANEILTPIHERMPVILASENYDLWLDVNENNPDKLSEILRPAPDGEIKVEAVSTKVNNAKYDRPDCLEKV
jgi:putative SOS response-associated peptidase YedK